MLSDETGLLQLGHSEDTLYHSFADNLRPDISAWDKFPTAEDPLAKYKFTSININLDKHLQ